MTALTTCSPAPPPASLLPTALEAARDSIPAADYRVVEMITEAQGRLVHRKVRCRQDPMFGW